MYQDKNSQVDVEISMLLVSGVAMELVLIILINGARMHGGSRIIVKFTTEFVHS